VETGERVRKWKGHSLVVNSCGVSRNHPELVVSGSDDGCVKLWDAREKNAVETFEDGYQVTAACFSDAGDMVFTGGINNEIKVKGATVFVKSRLCFINYSNFVGLGFA
jgi:Prp8 binding protein